MSASVGWLGSVATFLALALAGLASSDALIVRAAYLAMDLIGWCVIVPLSFASLLTGIVQSLHTSWGLFRQYWVLVKLLMTVPSTALLLVHMQPLDTVAAMASRMAFAGADLHGERVQLAIETIAALVVLLAATALSVYKPEGVTRYGWLKQRQQRAPSRS